MHFRIPTLFCVLSKNACMSHAGFKFIGLCVVQAGLPALSRSCHRCCWRLPRISNGKFAQVLEVAVFERIKLWWLSSIWSLSCLLFLFEITRKRYFLFERSVKDTLILDTFFQLSIFDRCPKTNIFFLQYTLSLYTDLQYIHLSCPISSWTWYELLSF